MAAYHCPSCGRRLPWCEVERVGEFVGSEVEQEHRFYCGGCGTPLRVQVRARAVFAIEARQARKEAA